MLVDPVPLAAFDLLVDLSFTVALPQIICAFEIFSGQKLPGTRRRQRFTTTWSLCVMSFVTFHVSHPYSDTVFILDQNILSFTLLASFCDRHTGWNCAIVVLSVLEVMSFSVFSVSDTRLPRYVNLWTLSIALGSMSNDKELVAVHFISWIFGMLIFSLVFFPLVAGHPSWLTFRFISQSAGI